jgi:hypothetical protein
MKRILKERLKPYSKTELLVPKGAAVVSSMFKDEDIFIYIEVDQHVESVSRIFRTIGTGWNVPKGPWQFVGTVVGVWEGLDDMVYHIYELLEKTERNLDELVSRMKESRNVVESPKSSPVDIAKNAFSMGWWCLEEGYETCDIIKADDILDDKMEAEKVSLNSKKEDLDGPYPSPR